MSPYRVPSIMLGPCINMVLLSQNFACTSENDTRCCCCSVTKSGPALCGPMDWSMPGFPALHYLPEFAQTHVHWIHDAIQLSHPLSPLLLQPSIFPRMGHRDDFKSNFNRWQIYGLSWDSWESLGLQGDPTSPFWRRSALGFLWKEWC